MTAWIFGRLSIVMPGGVYRLGPKKETGEHLSLQMGSVRTDHHGPEFAGGEAFPAATIPRQWHHQKYTP